MLNPKQMVDCCIQALVPTTRQVGLLSPSRLRFMEHEQEQRHGKTAECIDEGRDEHHCRLRAPQNVDDVEHKAPR